MYYFLKKGYMVKILNWIIFITIIYLIYYFNNKLNNIIGVGYFGIIKYFFIFLSMIFVIYPNFDNDYYKFKEKYIK